LPVKGKVTYKGKPLARGTVKFEPDGAGRAATGEIQSDGTFVLTTYKQGDGAVPGHHRVAVVGGETQAKEPVPMKFENFASSKLEIDVSQDKTEYAFNLP
jgi:hypothetical protein